MKILYASDSIIPSSFANTVQVLKMCDAFAENKHEVTLFASRGPGSCRDLLRKYGLIHQFPIVRTNRIKLRFLGSALYTLLQYSKVNKNGKPDLYYGRNCHLLYLLRKKSIPIIYETHNAPIGLRRRIEGKLFSSRNCVRVVTISNSLKIWYLENFRNLRDESVLVAHDGSTKVRKLKVNSVASIRRDARPCIGYTGSLFPGKGIEIILQISAQIPKADFHVFGGSQEEITKIRNTSEVPPNVIFHGHIEHYLLPSYRDQFDVALLPVMERVFSTYDRKLNMADFMSPMKIFEYMASGLPIVASDLPVIREVLSDNGNALLVKSKDIRRWVVRIQQLLEEKSLAQKIGKQAKDDFESKYTWTKRAKNVLANVI